MPALSLLSGTWFAADQPGGAVEHCVPLAALLVAMGLAWGRAPGRLLAWAAMGALLAWARPELVEDCLGSLDRSKPVSLLGEQDSAWQSTELGWQSSLSVRRVRQDNVVLRCSGTIALTAAGESPPAHAAIARIKGFLKKYEPLRNGTDRHPTRPDRGGPWRVHLKSQRFWMASEAGTGSLPAADWLGGLGLRFRGWVEEGFAGSETSPGVKAARALVLGQRSALDLGFKRSLRRFGLSHLFAVSGLHVALVGMLVHWLLRGLRHRPRLVLTALAVLTYLVLVGARPSIIRATAMSLLAFGAVCSRRPPNSRQALCLAAAALVVVDPAIISNLGYQLTVSATAGILWLSPALEIRWHFLPRGLRRSLAATTGAQLGSLPWTASAFSLVHPLGPLLNLLAIPWMAAFALYSFLATMAMKVVPASRGLMVAGLDAGIEPIAWLAGLPPSRWFVLPIALSFGEACLLAVSLASSLLLRASALRLTGLAVAMLLLRGPSLPDVAEVVALDVGQGDAILLHDGTSAVLVDGGGWRTSDIAAAVLVPTLSRLGIRRLSAVVVTHADIDHCGGLVDLSYYLPIDRIWSAPGATRARCVRELVSSGHARWRQLWRGESVKVGRISLEVLHPGADAMSRGNDSSLVIRADLDGRSILLTGDVEARSEREMLARYARKKLRSDILKLAHHGSRTSTTDRFLEAVSPGVALVSAGRGNRYGHPAAEVLNRCRRHRVPVARTDRHGMIRLRLEPNSR